MDNGNCRKKRIMRRPSIRNRCSFKGCVRNGSVRQLNNVNNLKSFGKNSGNFTREVYNAICLRLGDTLYIPEDSVQALFNDVKLYPSKLQVSKMLQCARQCSKRNGSNYLTFGEFCVFVREMQSQSPRQVRRVSQTRNNRCAVRCEVFLGGSCNPTTWRADTAIPELQKQGITFYNPQVSTWAPELIAEEHNAKQSASVLLFVIDSQTRSTVGMLEVAYLVAAGRCVVIVAQPYKVGQSIMGEPISTREYMDLMEGQKTVLNLVMSRGVKIHSNLSLALQCTTNILRNTSNTGTSAEELITYKLRKLREVYDEYNGEMKLYNVLEAYQKLTNRSLEINKLYAYLGAHGNGTNRTAVQPVTFERFCVLMAEFTTDGGAECDMCSGDAWATQPFHRQVSTNNNTTCNSLQQTDNHVEPQTQNSTSPYDVYLGGSLTSKTRWRETIAIPLLKKHGLKYYNPAIREGEGVEENGNEDGGESGGSGWETDMLEKKRRIDEARVLLFVVTGDTRSLTTMILAVHYMGLGERNMVVCVENLDQEGCVVKGETLTKLAIKDYNRARVYLRDMAERRSIPVFDNITEAVECAAQMSKQPR